jgi:hypothetical protein
MPVKGSTTMPVTGSVSAVLNDRVPGTDTAYFYLRTKGSGSWNVTNGRAVEAGVGTRATYRVEAGKLLPGRTYEFAIRTCNAAKVCGAPTGVSWFTTAS